MHMPPPHYCRAWSMLDFQDHQSDKSNQGAVGCLMPGELRRKYEMQKVEKNLAAYLIEGIRRVSFVFRVFGRKCINSRRYLTPLLLDKPNSDRSAL